MKRLLFVASLCALVFFACSEFVEQNLPGYAQTQSAILNGKVDNAKSHQAVVALYFPGYGSFCTGTLITPKHVLTAAHCVKNTELPAPISDARIGFGAEHWSFDHDYAIEKVHPCPDFENGDKTTGNDIAVVELKTSVPSSVANPIAIIPPSQVITAEVIKKRLPTGGYPMTVVGFGERETGEHGKKMKYDHKVLAYCDADQIYGCVYENYFFPRYAYIYNNAAGGTCSGDSGGPLFAVLGGKEYVVAVSTAVYPGPGPEGENGNHCRGLAFSTSVADHDDFIRKMAPLLPDDEGEICYNEKDDNGDGLVDCNDPTCEKNPVCGPEICNNQIDDNADGNVDCDDKKCVNDIHCQAEICDNQIDDNANDKIDCKDPQCASAEICQPENCYNGKDDNGNNLVDCDDPECSSNLICSREICDNQVDDNGNGLVDCNDPVCFDAIVCSTIIETCNNGIDDDQNGQTDCNDDACADHKSCVKPVVSTSESSSCNTTLNGKGQTPWWLAFAALLPWLLLRRRRRSDAVRQ